LKLRDVSFHGTKQLKVLDILKLKGETAKDKIHPRTDHEGPNGEERYSCTLSLTGTRGGG
jgi:hypothetical protein